MVHFWLHLTAEEDTEMSAERTLEKMQDSKTGEPFKKAAPKESSDASEST